MNSAVRLKPFISFLLLCLMSCKALLSASGGVSLSFHHDFSFHLDAGVAEVGESETDAKTDANTDANTDAKLPTALVEVGEHTHDDHHHHHELKLTAEMDPTVRGNTFDRVEAPVLVMVMDLFDSNFIRPVSQMTGGSAIRPPPERVPKHLSLLRTQVLRL